MPFGQCIFPKPSAATPSQTSLLRDSRARFSARCLAATSLRSCARPSVCATSLRIAALRLIYGAFRRASPRSNEVGTTSRTTNRPRGLRLFSRQLGLNEDATGTIRAGRENRSPPRLAAPSGSPSARGIFPLGARRDTSGTSVDDGRGAVGCLWRGRLLGWTCDIGGLGAVPPCRQPYRSRRHRAQETPAEGNVTCLDHNGTPPFYRSQLRRSRAWRRMSSMWFGPTGFSSVYQPA